MIFLIFTIELKKLGKIIGYILGFVIVCYLLLLAIKSNSSAVVNQGEKEYTLYVDPGHGGIDSGAVSDSGVIESEINRAITDRMMLLCDFMSINCRSTVEGGTNADSREGYSERENLLSRAEVVNKDNSAVLISVHQNKYPNDLPRGAETMYSGTVGSKTLGTLIQDNLISQLDNSNRRVARPAPDNLLLTSSVNCPAVLVECGFLSNPEEAEMLADSDYQLKIAAVLIGSYIQFYEINTPV